MEVWKDTQKPLWPYLQRLHECYSFEPLEWVPTYGYISRKTSWAHIPCKGATLAIGPSIPNPSQIRMTQGSKCFNWPKAFVNLAAAASLCCVCVKFRCNFLESVDGKIPRFNQLVGKTQPIWKICATSKLEDEFPNFRGENKKCLSCPHPPGTLNNHL